MESKEIERLREKGDMREAFMSLFSEIKDLSVPGVCCEESCEYRMQVDRRPLLDKLMNKGNPEIHTLQRIKRKINNLVCTTTERIDGTGRVITANDVFRDYNHGVSAPFKIEKLEDLRTVLDSYRSRVKRID